MEESCSCLEGNACGNKYVKAKRPARCVCYTVWCVAATWWCALYYMAVWCVLWCVLCVLLTRLWLLDLHFLFLPILISSSLGTLVRIGRIEKRSQRTSDRRPPTNVPIR